VALELEISVSNQDNLNIRELKMTSKCSLFLLFLFASILGCSENIVENKIDPNPIEIAAKKACDCDSVSVKESLKNGQTSIQLTVRKTKNPDFRRRTIKIMKQIAKDVKGFCNADEISINFVSNTHDIPDRIVYCKCPEERKPQASDSIILQLNRGIICKSSSSRIVKRENGRNILILAIRNL
jgi:hypothetical protein